MNHILIRIPYALFGIKWWAVIKQKTPSSWDELTPEQLVYILQLIDRCDDIYRFRLETVRYFLKLKWYQLICIPAEFFVLHLFNQFRWIEESNEINRTHFPKLAGLYGPPDKFVGMTGLEFALLDGHYMQFRNGDKNSLDTFLACIYREKRKDYRPKEHGHDKREELNPYGIPFLARKLKKVNYYKKLSVVRYYESYRQRLEEHYKEIFSTAEKAAKKHGWPDIFMKMAETNVFGTIAAVENAPISMIFRKMRNDIHDFEEFKRKNKLV